MYKLIPFKKELFSTLKIIHKPRKSIYRHLHFTGTFKVKEDNLKEFKIKHYGHRIENEIFWEGLTGSYEKESIKLWIKLCKNADVILDIGANTGIYALTAKAVNPVSKVYAFEPVKRVFEKLQENISLNNFDIVAIEKAVSDADGMATIFETTGDHVYSVTVNKNLSSADTKVIEKKIQTVTLNSFIKQYNLQKIDLIKMDVETHEPEVLKGFSQYIEKFMPSILIEISEEAVGIKVNKIISGLGYLIFNIDEEGHIRQEQTVIKSDSHNYLLCSEEVSKQIGIIK